STFAVNDVIQSARIVLKRYYFSIMGLCVLLFLIPTVSTILSATLSGIPYLIKILFLILIVLSYLGCQLTIIKYIFHALDKEENEVSFIKATPSTKEVLDFFLGLFYFMICCVLILAACFLLGFPIIYLVGPTAVFNIAISFARLVIFIASLRILFFPFFIIDRQVQPLRALRLSLAITRGNFTKLLILLSFFAVFHALYLYLDEREYLALGFLVLFINSFLIVPLSSVALSVAYRSMMSEYTGDQDPDVMDNII
ncbi:MAG TPA: hypothetical protein VF602_12145, partial [Pedobacter sp.]